MLEIIYRIYEVADKETADRNRKQNIEFGLCLSTSQAENIELLMDCMLCDSRDQFKDIIRSEYGYNIPFRYSKKLQPGDVYCIIIGEHCYNSERYFNKITFNCDCCNSKVETYFGRPIMFSDYEIKCNLFGCKEYQAKRFCSEQCKAQYKDNLLKELRPEDDQEFYIRKDSFTENVNGYIYLITKKSTGEFYVGQTAYAPVFRWGEHLKTDRFPINKIEDYTFEVLEIVPENKNRHEREKYWIQTLYKANPQLSLNIACTKNLIDKKLI